LAKWGTAGNFGELPPSHALPNSEILGHFRTSSSAYSIAKERPLESAKALHYLRARCAQMMNCAQRAWLFAQERGKNFYFAVLRAAP
jgi:hypothetical protein